MKNLQKITPKIKLINNPNKYQSSGRNLAILQAKFDLIAYIDGHSIADENWLSKLYSVYSELLVEDEKLIGVGSQHLNANETPLTKAIRTAFNSYLGGRYFTSFSQRNNLQKVFTTYACLYNKNKLTEIGLYNENLKKGEDLELNWRLTKQ